MRVLITGSAGRIGRLQVEVIQQAGHTVRTLDTASQANAPAGIQQIVSDLLDLDAVRRAVEGMDAVVSLGAIPNDLPGKEAKVFEVNVVGTWNVLQACAEAGVPRVVFYSSVNSLGNFGGHRPAAWLPIDDTYPHHPMTTYQLTKHLNEEACRSYTDRYGIVTICLRPVYVAQPGDYSVWRERGDTRNPHWLQGDYWAYVDVRDVCQAGLLGLTAENITHAAFLLTAADTASEIPTLSLVEQIYPETPWKQDRAGYLAMDPHRSLVDCTHAREVLGWQPRHSWREAQS